MAVSTIGTGSIGYLTNDTPQTKTFIAEGREWVFHGDGSDVVFRSRVIGESDWSAATVLKAGIHSIYFSLWWDGNRVHVTYTSSTALDNALLYKVGAPASDGTITWEAERTVTAAGTRRNYRQSVTVNSTGYPVVAYSRNDNTASNYYRVLLKIATAKDGSAWGSEVEIEKNDTNHVTSCRVLPLTDGKLIVLFDNHATGKVRSRYHDGADWQAAQDVATYSGAMSFSSVVLGSKVLCTVYANSEIQALEWTADTWGAASKIADGTRATLTKINESRVYAFVRHDDTQDDKLYSVKYDGSWGTPAEVCPLTDFVSDELLNSDYQVIRFPAPPYSPNYEKDEGNPLLQKGAAESWDEYGIRDPMLLVDAYGYAVKEDDKYIMYYNGRDNSDPRETAVGRATSTDGINWTKEATNPVFDDVTNTGAGSVIKRGTGDYIMFYHIGTDGGFNYATSSDGISWTKNTDDPTPPILSLADCDLNWMAIPNVIQIGSTQYMVFEGDGGGVWSLCMATSTDWKTWSYTGIIYEGTPGSWDEREAANPSLYKLADNDYIILYNGNDTGGYFDIGVLQSSSITSGWRQRGTGPIIARGAVGQWDSHRLEGARMYMDDYESGTVRLWYFGTPSTDAWEDAAIGLATCDSWLSPVNQVNIIWAEGTEDPYNVRHYAFTTPHKRSAFFPFM